MHSRGGEEVGSPAHGGRVLPRRFYARSTIQVALDLIGKVLSHKTSEGRASGRIVEVEAYLGEKDPASHAFGGRRPSTEIFWGDPGHANVYFIYGMHYCINAVTEKRGLAGAVLIRALEPIEGIPLMKKRRRTDNLHSLCNGPGKLTQALRINAGENSADLTKGNLVILDDRFPESTIAVTRRIGISKAMGEPLRFLLKDSPFVSKQSRNVVDEGTARELAASLTGGYRGPPPQHV